MDLAFYLGLSGSAVMLLSTLLFFMGSAGEASLLFIAMALVLVISSAGLFIALALIKKGVSGVAFSLFSFWALGGFVLGELLDQTSGIMILRKREYEGSF